MSLQIETKRLTAEIEYLARISDTPYPSVTRVLFSSVDLQAREWLKLLYADAGLVVREDAVGNTFARWAGTDPAAAPVATCGLVQVLPGAVNSIPREVRLEIDVRDIDGARRDGVLAAIRTAAQAAAARRGCGFKEQLINADPPATCAPHIVTAVEQAAAALGLPCQRMISRAYHDALFMAQVCPTAMVFVPSKDGISHRPDEYTSPEEVANGVRVLAGSLAVLAG